MRETRTFSVPGFEKVELEVAPDWAGVATLRWERGGVASAVDVPGPLFREIMVLVGTETLERRLDQFLASLEGAPS
jgi:hypothetical protein